MKKSSVTNTINIINDFIGKFILMTEDERLFVIEHQDKLSNIEQVALIQSKKYMTSKEKRVYSRYVSSMQESGNFEK